MRNEDAIRGFLFPARIAAAGLCLLFVVGCAGPLTLPLPGSDRLKDRSETIVPGRTDREAVRGALGKPVVSSRHWRFDLFRKAAPNVVIMLVFVPLPMGWSTDYHYMLVSYDSNGVVEALDSGIKSGWAEEARTGRAYNFSLNSGDILFQAEHETLLVNPARRNEYLESVRTAPHCTIVVGCGANVPCFNTLVVGKGASLHLPFDTLITTVLPPGEHVLQVWSKDFSKRTDPVTFGCHEGEVLFLEGGINVKTSGRRFWNIEVREDMPPSFATCPLVCYQDGRWLVEVEPNEETRGN